MTHKSNNTNSTPELNDTVLTRLDTAVARDAACVAALDAWYDFKNQFDVGGALAHLDLHHAMDVAWVDCIEAVKRAAWLDGFACGRDVSLLIFQQEGQVER
jgi:hypothetical protein